MERIGLPPDRLVDGKQAHFISDILNLLEENMNTKPNLKSLASILMITAILIGICVINVSAAPGNDNFADATVIGAFPYNDSSNTSSATIEPGDPYTCGHQFKSIWYTYTPESDATLIISANTDYRYYVTLSIYQSDNGYLSPITCFDQAQVTTNVNTFAGITYYIEVNSWYQGGMGPYPDPPADVDGGNVTLNIDLALPPENDNFANAKAIAAVPYSDSVDPTFATTEPGEPDPYYWNFHRTIWYAFSPPVNSSYTISSSGGYYTIMAIYTGPDLYNLQTIATNYGYGETSIVMQLTAGTIYYIQTYITDWGGPLAVNVVQNFPPANDDFANATPITETPYSNILDATFATTEPGEQSPCYWNLRNTVWYAFTPTTSGSYTATSRNPNGNTEVSGVLAVYTGTDLNDLQNIACIVGWSGSSETTLSLDLEAGTKYYYQTYYFETWFGWTMNFLLYPTPPPPPPEATFNYWPGDPSKFDTVYFDNYSYDPHGDGISTTSWDFGDGSTSTDWSPSHVFSTDGDYTVQLTVATVDQRTASTSQTVQVRTHDVGVTRLAVPSSARVGQSKQINVSVKNLYYPENVQVDLYKSSANGYVWVGSLNQSMPVRPANRAQVFPFAYTFTSEDAAQGKVTFRAVVTLLNARDAYSPDNEMISLAVKVAR